MTHPRHERRPGQAVILAGGRGLRLGALTADRPKPMVALHGRPFLEYLIEMLRDQGFSDVLLLLGYRAESVQDHFGDGRDFGVNVRYSITDPDRMTAHRLRTARDLIDETFLLMYCDNYWPLQLEQLWSRYLQAGTAALTTVYSNTDGYSRSNIRVSAEGVVERYDRTRTASGLNGVEIGYAILRRDVLDLLPEEDKPVEEALYPRLASTGELAAYVTDHRYYGVGSIERLPLTERFLARTPAVIVDRDGVLNRRAAPGRYIRNVAEFEWLPGSLDALRHFREAGYRIIVASNQAGIARGEVTISALEEIHQMMRVQAGAAGGAIDAIYYCPHAWDAGCVCRKPKPGLLFQAQREFSIDLTRTFFLGDDERDLQAAEAAGALGRLVTADEPLLAHARRILASGTSSLSSEVARSSPSTFHH